MTKSSFTQLKEALSRARNELIVRKSERDLYLGQLKQTEERWQVCLNERDLLEKVRVLFQLSAEHAREQAKQQLETLVTNALKYVFGSAFRFEIELKDHGGTPTAEFYVVSTWDGQEIKNRPQEARGGGIVDIVSLALRIALIETVKPRLSGPIILDEPGKHVSEDYIVPMIEFLKSVGETFGRQVILVTHNIHLTESADAAYFVRLQGGKSVVEQSGRLDNGIA
ncbi:ATP-binding protein [Laceyella tengchongensis]|uniref:ATP-binding protein n=1 Tax=Laceyella tengchongensis TaxID=574699 RepID=UPI0012B7E6D2|nr:ATP-binding protein [Laceyella tengchongensis]